VLSIQCLQAKATKNPKALGFKRHKGHKGKKPKTPKKPKTTKQERPNQNSGARHPCLARASWRIQRTTDWRGKFQKNSYDVTLVAFHPWHCAHPLRSPHEASATSPEEVEIAKQYVGAVGAGLTMARKQLLREQLNNKSPSSKRSAQDVQNLLHKMQEQATKTHAAGPTTPTTTTAELLAPLVADPNRALVAVIEFDNGQFSTLIKRAGARDTAFVPGEPFVKSTCAFGRCCSFACYFALAICAFGRCCSLRVIVPSLFARGIIPCCVSLRLACTQTRRHRLSAERALVAQRVRAEALPLPARTRTVRASPLPPRRSRVWAWWC
jgi:hypothetical protein